MSCRILQKVWLLCHMLKTEGTTIGHLTWRSTVGGVQRWENPECVWRIARTQMQTKHTLRMSEGEQLPWLTGQDCGPRQTEMKPPPLGGQQAHPTMYTSLCFSHSRGPQHPQPLSCELSPTLLCTCPFWPSLSSISSWNFSVSLPHLWNREVLRRHFSHRLQRLFIFHVPCNQESRGQASVLLASLCHRQSIIRLFPAKPVPSDVHVTRTRYLPYFCPLLVTPFHSLLPSLPLHSRFCHSS